MLGVRNQHVHPFAGLDLAKLMAMRVAERGEHPFLVWEPFEGERRTWTYLEFLRETRTVAAGLAA
ncbi:MAG TPA: hypothetical protein VMU42_01075, partial [Candidatus Sulfotelmatobacter sp.]|nr:hypothetical protein [Candidatus Sulfotelmatobacter sp.]